MWSSWSVVLAVCFYRCREVRASSMVKPTLHVQLTVEELRRTFAVERHSDVPDYQLTHVRSVSKRSLRGDHRRNIRLKAFQKNIHLKLLPNHEIDNDVRLFFANSRHDSDDISIERVPGDREMRVGNLYQDVDNNAAVLLDHAADDTLMLSGTIDDLVITPLPPTLKQHVPYSVNDAAYSNHPNATASSRKKRSVPSTTSGVHIIYKRSTGSDSAESALSAGFSDAAYLADDVSTADSSFRSQRHKRDVPALYPEVLLILDYDTYAVHDFNAKRVKKYILSFMNALDLRYRLISSPVITLKLAGIVISNSRKATPYLESNMVTDTKLNAVTALSSVGEYLFRERSLPSYDIALVITKRDMCTRQGVWGSCDKVTAGYAYVGGGCSVSRYYGRVNSVGLIEDSGGFSGIIVAAHELGHLLGAVHDGSRPAPYVGGPGATLCPWTDGYIMSDLRRDYKGVRWSACSVHQFQHFARSKQSSCMRNHPSENKNLPRTAKLPGKLMSLDAQCRKDRGSSACFRDHRVCVELYCFEPSSGYCVSYRPAAEGSTCGVGMHCIDGLCQSTDSYHR